MALQRNDVETVEYICSIVSSVSLPAMLCSFIPDDNVLDRGMLIHRRLAITYATPAQIRHSISCLQMGKALLTLAAQPAESEHWKPCFQQLLDNATPADIDAQDVVQFSLAFTISLDSLLCHMLGWSQQPACGRSSWTFHVC